MQLVTDNAADISTEQLEKLPVELHRVALALMLDGKTYESGVDISNDSFYELMENSDNMPTTSQPAPGDIAELYRGIAEKTGDKDMLSVHISSGLSGTPNAVRLAAQQVAEEGINVELIDTLTLSAPEGWQVEAAAYGIAAGWSVDQIRAHLKKVHTASDAAFTLPTLDYLIHGGRISHLSGLVASTLGIKPIIGVSKEQGNYETRARVRTFKKAITAIADAIENTHAPGMKLRVQPLHAHNMDAVEKMKATIAKKYKLNGCRPWTLRPFWARTRAAAWWVAPGPPPMTSLAYPRSRYRTLLVKDNSNWVLIHH